MFSSKNCNFFHFNFLHQGLCQSIICHRFSILGSLMLEESSATLHRWKSELSSATENMNFPVQKKGTFQCSNLVTVLDIALQLPFPVIPQAVFFMHLCMCWWQCLENSLCLCLFFQHYVFFCVCTLYGTLYNSERVHLCSLQFAVLWKLFWGNFMICSHIPCRLTAPLPLFNQGLNNLVKKNEIFFEQNLSEMGKCGIRN